MEKSKFYTGHGRLVVPVAIENGNLVGENINFDKTLPRRVIRVSNQDFREPVKKILLATGVENPFGDLNIYFKVNGCSFTNECDNPKGCNEEREIVAVCVGHSLGPEHKKYVEIYIEDENNLYDDIFWHFIDQIEKQEYELQ